MENRFNAFDRAEPPAAEDAPPPAAAPLAGPAVGCEPAEAEAPLAAEASEELAVDDDVLPEAAGLKAGVLEMEVVVAREADGNADVKPWWEPRSRGTIRAEKRSGAVTPVSRMTRWSEPAATRTVRTEPRAAAGLDFAAPEPAARTSHTAPSSAADITTAIQRPWLRRSSGF